MQRLVWVWYQREDLREQGRIACTFSVCCTLPQLHHSRCVKLLPPAEPTHLRADNDVECVRRKRRLLQVFMPVTP